MSRENVELMRRMNEAFNRDDIEATLAFYHPLVEWRDVNHPPDAPEYARGTDALREIWDGWRAAFGALRADVQEFIDAGSAVISVTRWHADGRVGPSVDQMFAEVYEFEGGLIVRATLGYSSRHRALKAVGLEE